MTDHVRRVLAWIRYGEYISAWEGAAYSDRPNCRVSWVDGEYRLERAS